MNDKLSKSVWQLVCGIKDQTQTNLVTAVSTGKVKIERDDLQRILDVVNASIEQGFHKGHKTLVRSFEAIKADEKKQSTPQPKKK